jgi:hypothetical protein
MNTMRRVRKKKIGNKPGAAVGTPIAVADHEYNIRGWLLSINKNYINNSSNNDEWFGMQLGYEKNPSLGTLYQLGFRSEPSILPNFTFYLSYFCIAKVSYFCTTFVLRYGPKSDHKKAYQIQN